MDKKTSSHKSKVDQLSGNTKRDGKPIGDHQDGEEMSPRK